MQRWNVRGRPSFSCSKAAAALGRQCTNCQCWHILVNLAAARLLSAHSLPVCILCSLGLPDFVENQAYPTFAPTLFASRRSSLRTGTRH
jgi:hypothetical protein